MNGEEKKVLPTAADHELALKVYIDSLLLEPAFEAPAEVEVESHVHKPVEQTVADTEITEQAAAVPDEQPVQQEIISDTDEPFECILFKVAGFLTLAVPMVGLNGIVQWDGEITPIPGHAGWFLGLVSYRGHQVKVIDIAKFVIPENHKSRHAVDGEREFKHLLLIDDGKFGLACDDLGQVLKLTSDKVRWRKDRNSRPWLAGTLIEQMSALIDIDKFTVMLKEDTPLDEIS